MKRTVAGRVAVMTMAAVLVTGTSLPAHAANKDMIQLQAQIQQLQDAVARLQQANDERMGVLKDLVQQTADAVNKMTLTMSDLKMQVDQSAQASAARNDAVAGQVQSLNDSLDELKARMAKMEKMLGDVQSQQQQTTAILGNMQPAAPAGNGAAPNAAPPPAGPADNSVPPAQPGAPIPMPDNAAPQAADTAAPPVGSSVAEMYRRAYSDYIAGKTQLASSEFGDLIKAYPDDNLSGNAYFYLGEMSFRGNKPAVAIKNYDHTIEHYPNNAKIPAAELHKAESLRQMGQHDAAARELRALIQRYPASPEAAQAKVKLSALRR